MGAMKLRRAYCGRCCKMRAIKGDDRCRTCDALNWEILATTDRNSVLIKKDQELRSTSETYRRKDKE